MLRETVGESFNVFQATLTMGSIFMGFIFAAILQILLSNEVLSSAKILLVYILVIGLLCFHFSLLLFHATAIQVVRYWSIFFPSSFARTVASFLFQIGMMSMFFSIGVILWNKEANTLKILSILTFLADFVIIVLSIWIQKILKKVKSITKVG